MKEIKNIFLSFLFICTILFISSLNISYFYKVNIIILILILLFIYYLSYIVLKKYTDFLFSKFIQILINELPKEDIEALIDDNILLKKYNNTLKGIYKTQMDIIAYAEKNFNNESNEKLLNGLHRYNEILENIDNYINFDNKNRISTKNILHLNLSELFIYFAVPSIQRNSSSMTKRNNIFSIPYILYTILNVIFIFFHNNVIYMLLLFIFVGLIYLHKNTKKHIAFSTIMILSSWVCLLISVVLSPILLTINTYNKSSWFLLHIMLLFVIITGIWITNEMWTYLDIEKRNMGAFFPKYKIIYVIEAKIMKKLRYCWLWIAFFIIIIGVISLYFFIYLGLSFGSVDECIMMSLKSYFIGSGDNIYFMAETITSFFVNTLYISNIVKLILEPKLK